MKRLLTTAKAKSVINLLVLCAAVVFTLPFDAYAFPAKNVPILMYHKVDGRTPSTYWVSLRNFRNQAFYLQDQGYTSVDYDDLYDHVKGIRELPAKPVILTFDDGYENVYTHAMPLLAERGLFGVSNCGPTNYFGNSEPNRMSNTWDIAAEYYCTQLIWPEVTALYNNGFSIAGHGQLHKQLASMTDAEKAGEVASRHVLATNAGIPTPNFYVYPFGSSDANFIQRLKNDGYLGALNASGGTETTTRLEADPNQLFLIRRIPVNQADTLATFAGYVGGTVPSKPVLTVSTVGNGSVQISPDQPYYNTGTVVNLTANPDPGYTFSAWSGGLTGSTNPTTVTMDATKTVTATFVNAGTIPFYDGFESGGTTHGGWTAATGATASTTAPYTDTYSLRLAGSTGTTTITKAQSTVGYNTIHVKYDRTFVNTTSVTMVVDWSVDGTTWNTLETVTIASNTIYAPWVSKDFTLPAGADNNAGFRIRFRTTAGTSTQYVYIDNVEITPPVAPRPATSPTPENSAINVGVTADLCWTAGRGATSHDVYFGTSASPPFIGNQTGAIFNTGTMSANTTYYWRINEKNATGTTTGTVWSFTTAAAPGQATTPTPANAANVNLPATLSWTAGSGATSHDVYFGTAASPPFIANQGSTTYTPILTTNTTYYWRIDEKGLGGTTTGTVWNFTTTSQQPVAKIGSWTSGTTHAKETGTNRALVFTVHGEGAAAISVTGVTYGGQAMTKVIEAINASGTTRVYTAAFILNEAGITAATTTTFTPTWSGTTTGTGYGSVFFQNVNQSTLTGASAGNSTTTGATIATSALATAAGDMVVDAATCSTTGTYSVDNGFTKALELTVTGADGVDGYKSAPSVSETPSATHSNTTNRQSLIGFVVKVAASVVPPSKATSPNPANTAANVGVTTDLSWTAGSGATSHIVYFGTVSPGTLQGEQAGTTFDTGTMSYNTPYYWRIDEKNASGTTTGDVWSFTTNALVPNVVNMTQAAATTAINSAGLVVGTVTQQCSDTVPAGSVISQNPVGGTQVNVGSAVDLVVSTGQPTAPDVTGMTEAAAIAAINAVANISYGSSTTACSDTVPAGSVISQSATGTVPCGTVVNLVVSTGQPTAPDVTGMTEAAAIAAINAVANISYGSSTTQCSDTVPAGDVISQSAVGTVPCGTVVNLVVSTGQPTAPDVTGMTEAAAIAAINAVANISYGSSTTACSDTVPAGSVISQSATGTVPCGTVVNLVVSTGQPTAPDVTGMTEAAAIAAINAVANISYGSSTTACSDTVPAGDVISQSATGTVPCGTVVNLVVSTGQPTAPDVTGMTEAAAIAAINAVANISYGSSTMQCSDTVPAGDVISQSSVGTVPCGTVVNLVVSTGQPSVPNVVGMTEPNAIAAIGAVANISYGSSTTQCSDTVPAGSVISQSATGTVPCGTVVNLVVSTGQPTAPDVTGMTEAAAIAAINAVANISYGSSTTACSDTVPAGSVISQSAVGTVPCGTVVNLVVSTGQPTAPDVTGMTEAAAIAAINAVANISYGSSTTACSDTVPAGSVISQSATGTVPCGTVVNLVVSTGQPTAPDVTGMTEAAAIAAINAVANISYGSSTMQCSDTVPAGDVISQSSVGTVPCGTVVNLVVSTGQPSVPNVVGMTEPNAIAAIGAVANISYGSSTTQCSDTVPAGDVISQSSVGTVPCGTVVNLVVSTGQPSVPNVVGMTEPNAIAAIGAVANISYGSSTTQCSDTVPAGDVISQSSTGTVPCGTVVNLVVSLGQFPNDDFNDNRRGSMWRISVSDPNTMVIEDISRLNITSIGDNDLAAPCVGYWKMNDNVGNTTVIDSSGKGNNGTAQQNTSSLHTDSGNPPNLNGALTFNGTSDYVNVGNAIGTGAYTKVAWVKRTGGVQNNIISSSTWSHVFWAPSEQSFKLSAGHNSSLFLVQDSVALQTNTWYFVAVTFDPNVASGRMVLYKNGAKVDDANSVPTQISGTTYIGRFLTGYGFTGSIDNVMIFNRALSQEEIAYLYSNGAGTETIPSGGGYGTASYTANGWSFDVVQDFEVKADYHYSDQSTMDGRVMMVLEYNDGNYVELDAGFDGSQAYCYYEAVVDGNVVSSNEVARASNDGSLYVSYNAGSDELYLSFTGFGDANEWQTVTGLLAGQWSSDPVRVLIGGSSDGASLSTGEAYLDNFKVDSGLLLGWLPVTDIDMNGFIEWDDLKIMCDNWLDVGLDIPGNIFEDEDDIVNFLDFAEFGLAW